MRARTDEAVPTKGMLPQIISIVLVAAATVVLFSIASFSFLGTSPKPFTRSSSDGNSVELNSTRSGPAPFTGSNTALVPGGTTPPKPSFEPSPARDAPISAPEPQSTAQAPTRSATETPTAETNGGVGTPTEPVPPADEPTAPADPSGFARPAAPAADEIQQNRPVERDQANLPSGDDTAAQSAQNRHDPGYPLSAFRYRVKKECGPIINDPVLYRHCVSTFGVHYR